jgi:hypothetical protein
VAQVDDSNKREYVDLVAEHRMTTAIRAQIQAFLKGFWDMVPKVRGLPAALPPLLLLITSGSSDLRVHTSLHSDRVCARAVQAGS